ncbi:hypothetical protein [Acidobacterium sp. S8]|uniref:hypothetical protein n=1 Tax=Acidobacterium sp. S8 TaxID=1641854 RepID=UPI00131DBE10|nr:hypothetical protein [Acidobacterium sp. S8]
MNNIPAHTPWHKEKDCDSFTTIVNRLGMALFILGIFVPGAHSLMMVGMALIAISYIW